LLRDKQGRAVSEDINFLQNVRSKDILKLFDKCYDNCLSDIYLT